MKRRFLYDGACVLLVFGDLVLAYRAVEFLAQKDYVAGLLAVVMGAFMLRTAVEMGRLSVFSRMDT